MYDCILRKIENHVNTQYIFLKTVYLIGKLVQP